MTATLTATAPTQTEITAIQPEFYASFIKYIDASSKSISTYKTALKQLAKYFTENGITAPTREDLLTWRTLLTESGHKPTTVSLYITTARLFFQWTELSGLYPNIANHLKGAKLDRDHKKDYLTAAQVSDIIASIDTDTVKGKRDKALFLLMVTGGLRTIEVSRANVEDLRTLGGYSVLYIQGKGHTEKAEFIKVSAKTEKAIREYLNARKAKDDEPLFASTANSCTGERITTNSISRLIKTTLRANGFDSDRLTAHSLRHTAVTLALQSGNDITQVQEFARHKNINTTMIYAHTLNKINNNCSSSIDSMI